jgi:predicted transcriptional regulator
MTQPSTHNFHVPLPQSLYQRLRREAARTKQPATALARDAIAFWLHTQEKTALHAAIAAYATKHAGTEFDLDKAMEQASVEYLSKESQDS